MEQPSFKVKKWQETHERDSGFAGKDLKVKNNNCSKSSGDAAFGIRIKCLCWKWKDALTKSTEALSAINKWKIIYDKFYRCAKRYFRTLIFIYI